MAFPVNPNNGDTYTVNGTKYVYNSSKNSWSKVVSGQSSFVISNSNSSTSTTTGALIVQGGAGIGGNVYSGGSLYTANGVFWIGNNNPYSSGSGVAGSGTVNPASSTQLAFYAATGSAVSGTSNATLTNGQLTLGVAGTVAGNLRLSGSTTGVITIGATSVSGTYSLTLPATAGSAGNFLQTDGAGTLSWTGTIATATTASFVTGLTAANVQNVIGSVSTASFPTLNQNTTGTAASAATATTATTATFVTGLTTANVQSVIGTLSSFAVSGNATVGNLSVTGVGGQVRGYLTGAIGANVANTGAFTTLTATSLTINNAFTFPTTDGTNGYFLQTNGSGQLTWSQATGGGGGGTPGGSSTQVQFNDGGVLGGNNSFTFNKTTGNVAVGNIAATGIGGQLTGYLTGAIGANTPNTGAFTSISATSTVNLINSGSAGVTKQFINFNKTNATLASGDTMGGINWSRTLTDSSVLSNNITSNGSNDASAPQLHISYTSISDHIFTTSIPASTGSFAERMRITRGGNIGIGTTNPQSALHVVGNIISYFNGAIGANVANTGAFTTVTASGNVTVGNIAATGVGGQIQGYLTGAIGANVANTGAFTTLTTTGNIVVSSPGQLIGYHTGAIGANTPNSGTFNSLTVVNNGLVNLGDLANLRILGGTTGYFLRTDGLGNLSWAAASGSGGTGTPGGQNTQVQFNDNGAFGGSSRFTVVGTTGNVTVGNLTVYSGIGGQLIGYHTGAIGANVPNTGAFTTLTATSTVNLGSVTNLTITGGNNGQVLQTNGSGTLTWATVSSSAAGSKYTASPSAPIGPAAGDEWYDTTTDILYLYTNDGTSTNWVDINSISLGGGGIGSQAVSGSTSLAGLTDVSLTTPVSGQVLKYNSTTNKWENSTDLTGGSTGGGGGGGAGGVRSTVSASVTNLPNNITSQVTISNASKGYIIYKITTSSAAWVRVYSDTASRDADFSRSVTTDPTTSGLITEVVTTGSQTVLLTPGLYGFNNETLPVSDIPLAITNLSGTLQANLTVSLQILSLENTGRFSISGSTQTSIASNASGIFNITGAKGYVLYKISTNVAAWVRLYSDSASRDADATRSINIDPGPGVIAEAITSGQQTILVTPGIYGFNSETSPTSDIPIRVTNLSGGSTVVTVTLQIFQLEG